ncbi:MAG: hypothetical protein AB4911_08370 [Oscillochloridaceae bacterium umkhey_bin13]
MHDEEIDLRPWLRALLQRWKIVLGLALLGAGIFASVIWFQPRSSQASMTVLIAPNSAQITLDPRFVNRDATLLTNATFQRQALIGMATSHELVRRVAIAQGHTKPSQELLEDLRGSIRTSAQGDLLQVIATASTDQAALALAELWGEQYVRLVHETYSRDRLLTSLMTEQLADAEARYREEQRALEIFLGQSRSFEIDFQQRTLQSLVDGSIEAEKSLYTRYLQMTQQLDLILQDTETLRKQVALSTSDELANALGLLALQSRANGAGNLPIDLSLEAARGLRTEPVTVAEIDALVAIVREERDRLTVETAMIAERIAQGQPGPVTLDAATRDRYQTQLAALRREAEQVRAEERLLTQRRDTALSTVELLRRKLEEQRIAELTPQVSLRLLSVQTNPSPSILMTLVLSAGGGFVLGLSLGIIIALVTEVINRRRQAHQTLPQVGDPTPQSAIKHS